MSLIHQKFDQIINTIFMFFSKLIICSILIFDMVNTGNLLWIPLFIISTVCDIVFINVIKSHIIDFAHICYNEGIKDSKNKTKKKQIIERKSFFGNRANITEDLKYKFINYFRK